MDHAEFPSSEDLAAFIDGQLDEKTRKEVVAHVADCGECYDTLLAAEAWKKNEQLAPVVQPHFGARRWIAALAVAAAAAFAVFITPAVRDRVAIRELANAAGHRAERTNGELPLSGIPFRPEAPAFRGDSSGGDESNTPKDGHQLQAAAADVSDRAADHPNARNEQALGIAYLLMLDDAANRVNNAKHAFEHLSNALGGSDEQAIARSSDVDLLSDFGAAAYADGNLLLARAAYQRALAVDPHHAQAQFGLAATLQAMGRAAEAKAAWNGYLKLDSTSGWAADARKHLTQLE